MRLMELRKGGGIGTLKGLFLTACHRETFQLRRTKAAAREPLLLWLHPGNTSEMTWRVENRPGRLRHPPIRVDLSLWCSSKRPGIGSENGAAEGT